jgi:hypothetical protein
MYLFYERIISKSKAIDYFDEFNSFIEEKKLIESEYIEKYQLIAIDIYKTFLE